MVDNRQYMALEWVIRDIKETLSQAQGALDDYARESDDIVQLRFCLTYIHQVYGSLHMAGFHGAAMIASEAEALAKQLLESQVAQKQEAIEVLGKAIKQLPEYLDNTLKEKRDQPSLAFLLLNDLRAARGEQLLSESALFSPNLSPVANIGGQRHVVLSDDQQLLAILSKLREMYQYAAASVLHQKNTQENLAYLLKVSQRLQIILQGTPRVALWEIVSAFLSGVSENVIIENVAIKKLFRQLDEEIKQLIDGGLRSVDEKTSDNRLKNWLYYLAALQNPTREVNDVSVRYELYGAAMFTQDQDSVGAVELSAMRDVAKEIVADFENVKRAFDVCRIDQTLVVDITAIRHTFQRAADTLAILNVNRLRQEMLMNIVRVDQLKSYEGDIFPEEQLKAIETSLSIVESEIETSLTNSGQSDYTSSKRQFTDQQEEALQESRNGLEEAKDSVVHYIATQWNSKNLQPVPSKLRDVANHLSILSLSIPSEILLASASYIEMKLINGASTPDWGQLDSLADVIASVDYFLEVFSLTKEEDLAILKGAEKGLLELGAPSARVKQIISGKEAQQQDHAESSNVEQDVGEKNSVNKDAVQLDAAAIDAMLDEPETVAQLSSEQGVDDKQIDEETASEIIEIFIEEAEEVQETIAEYFPQWANDFSKEEALIEVRRGFHTLKGSGRLVKAIDIGELSWSIENMLNRVLDKTLVPSSSQVQLIEKVLVLLPPMVEAFKDQQPLPSPDAYRQYKLWAEQLAKGEVPQGLDEPSQSLSTVIEDDDDIDVQLWEIFGAESETHLAVVREYITEMEAVRPLFEVPSDVMQRAMHTIKGSAHMAEITSVAKLMTPMELFVKDLRTYQVIIDEDILQLIKDSVSYTEDALEQMSRLMFPKIPKLELFLARVAELRERSVGHLINHDDEANKPKVDPAFLETLMNEGMNSLLDIDPLMKQWRESSATEQEWQTVAKEVATVQHAAEKANLDSMVKISEALHQQYENLLQKRIQPTDSAYDVILDAHYELLDVIDAVAGGQDLPAINERLLEQLALLSETSKK